jgi:NAD(P)-dependent dehydrogenase (short-subunit alcohol dehydrogenase family)
MADRDPRLPVLVGTVAMVTGGGSGIGKAAALCFARAGADVVVLDRVGDAANAVADAARALGGQAVGIAADVSDSAAVADALRRVRTLFGRLDCAFNNAGIEGPVRPLLEYGVEEWDQVLAVNLTSVWHCMRQEIPLLLDSGGGAIVNAASVAGLVGQPGASAYCASKHGVIGLTRSVALEYAAKGIRVNAICPGPVRTAMMERLASTTPRLAEQLAQHCPMGRLAEPEEIARTVVWLASDASSYMTGSVVTADGGVSAA